MVLKWSSYKELLTLVGYCIGLEFVAPVKGIKLISLPDTWDWAETLVHGLIYFEEGKGMGSIAKQKKFYRSLPKWYINS